MSDGDALLRAILAAPDDDAPRLVYADWLDENGREREAVRIRYMCGTDLLGKVERVRRNTATGFGTKEITTGIYSHQFSLDCPTWCAEVIWSRGFIYSLDCTAADWLAHGDSIVSQHPVREVRLTTWPNETRAQYSHRWPGITFHLPQREVPPSLDGLLAGYASGIITANEVRDFLAGRH